jgi:hypothetical protein
VPATASISLLVTLPSAGDQTAASRERNAAFPVGDVPRDGPGARGDVALQGGLCGQVDLEPEVLFASGGEGQVCCGEVLGRDSDGLVQRDLRR